MTYEVLDLGSHEIAATFRNERDASAWAAIKSVNGPAYQVRPVKQGKDLLAENAMLRDAWLAAVQLAGYAAKNAVREAEALAADKAKDQPLWWVKEAAIGATRLKDKFDAFNTLRQLTVLDATVPDMPEVRKWMKTSGADVVKGLYCVMSR
jgi:hypothetical protein